MVSSDPDNDNVTLTAALVRAGERDQAALREVYHRTSMKLFGVCLRILPVRHEAEEALQEVYLSVWRQAGSFDPARCSAMTWLVTLARNCAIDRLRAGGKLNLAPIELADGVPDPSPCGPTMIESDEQRRRLDECIDALDGGDAQFVRAAFLEGSTYAELADRASMPLGTAKSRIRRALIKLRD